MDPQGRSSFRPIFGEKKKKKPTSSRILRVKATTALSAVAAGQNSQTEWKLMRNIVCCSLDAHCGANTWETYWEAQSWECVSFEENEKPKRSRFHSAVLGQIKEKEIFKHKAFKKKKKVPTERTLLNCLASCNKTQSEVELRRFKMQIIRNYLNNYLHICTLEPVFCY